MRLDHYYGRHLFFYRHSWSGLEAVDVPQTYPGQPPGTQVQRESGNAFGWDWSVAPAVANELRAGRSSYGFDLERPSRVAGPMVVANTWTDPLNTSMTSGRRSPVTEWSDNLAWIRGHHSAKMGANVRLTSWWESMNLLASPNVYFARSQNNTPASVAKREISAVDRASFELLYNDLLGRISGVEQAYYGDLNRFFPTGTGRARDWRILDYALFAQDDWPLTRNLRLSFGLRWEYLGRPTDRNGAQGMLDKAALVNRDSRIADFLIREDAAGDAIVIDAVIAANGGPAVAARIPREAEARREVVVIGVVPGAAADNLGNVRRHSRLWLWAAVLVAALASGAIARKWTSFGKSRSTIESIAVLPLVNLSGDTGQEYFADGMTEALTSDLAELGGVRVISRTSAMTYKGSRKPLAEIARSLNVDALVEGSVSRSGSHVRIVAKLIRASTDAYLWSRTYERDFADVLRLEAEVAQAIAGEIRVAVSPERRAQATARRPVRPEAYEAYLKGMFHLNKFTPDGFERGTQYLQQAIAKDPDDPQAYAALALGYAMMGHERFLEAFTRAKEAAHKAPELDPNFSPMVADTTTKGTSSPVSCRTRRAANASKAGSR